MRDLSIIVPAYNEAEALPATFARLEALCASLAGTSVEVLFVDDHSADDSPALLARACAEHESFRHLRLSSNSGSHIAVFAGLEHCTGRCAVFLAADLQDPPELVPKMLDLWRQGYEVVWAVREGREGIPWTERVLARTFYSLFNRMAHVSLPPQGTDFALVDRVVIEALRESVSATPFLMGDIAVIGFRQTTIDYVKEARHFGRTKWNLRRKLRLFADAFVACSYFPLRVMSYVGILCSVLGFLYALLVIAVGLLVGTPMQGWASIMVAVLVLGGVQMTMLGVLGEYLWRTLEAARRRPLYFIEGQHEQRGEFRPPEPVTKPADAVEMPAPGQRARDARAEIPTV